MLLVFRFGLRRQLAEFRPPFQFLLEILRLVRRVVHLLDRVEDGLVVHLIGQHPEFETADLADLGLDLFDFLAGHVAALGVIAVNRFDGVQNVRFLQRFVRVLDEAPGIVALGVTEFYQGVGEFIDLADADLLELRLLAGVQFRVLRFRLGDQLLPLERFALGHDVVGQPLDLPAAHAERCAAELVLILGFHLGHHGLPGFFGLLRLARTASGKNDLDA